MTFFGLGLAMGQNSAALGGSPLLDGSESDGTSVLPSSDFIAGWNYGFGATLTSNSTNAPDGTTTAALLKEDSATSRHIIFAQGPVTGSFTASIYLKQNTRRYFQLYIQATAGGNAIHAVVDLTTGTITDSGAIASGTFTSATIQAAVNGFYKLTLAGTVAAGADTPYFICLLSDRATQSPGSTDSGNISYTGNGSSSCYIWRPKLVD